MSLMSAIGKHATYERTKLNVCVWSYNSDGFYDTACVNAFMLESGSLKENKFKFCPYCGKRIKEFVKRDGGSKG
jgi:hypothetical protein